VSRERSLSLLSLDGKKCDSLVGLFFAWKRFNVCKKMFVFLLLSNRNWVMYVSRHIVMSIVSSPRFIVQAGASRTSPFKNSAIAPWAQQTTSLWRTPSTASPYPTSLASKQPTAPRPIVSSRSLTCCTNTECASCAARHLRPAICLQTW
jgi:hypothetical protein